MKKENKAIREPYKPDDTPKPPQIIDPNNKQERENPVEGKNRPAATPSESNSRSEEKTSGGKPHLLGDEAEIDDETTI